MEEAGSTYIYFRRFGVMAIPRIMVVSSPQFTLLGTKPDPEADKKRGIASRLGKPKDQREREFSESFRAQQKIGKKQGK